MSPIFFGNRRIAGACNVCGSKRVILTRNEIGLTVPVCLDCENDQRIREATGR